MGKERRKGGYNELVIKKQKGRSSEEESKAKMRQKDETEESVEEGKEEGKGDDNGGYIRRGGRKETDE